jgi:pullulanase/glycogen debranching enzyme
MHVAGFTKHPNSGIDPAKRGTYAGLIDKIPHLRDLGVTAVELQPVFSIRRPRCARRINQLLGVFAGFLLCSSLRI